MKGLEEKTQKSLKLAHSFNTEPFLYVCFSTEKWKELESIKSNLNRLSRFVNYSSKNITLDKRKMFFAVKSLDDTISFINYLIRTLSISSGPQIPFDATIVRKDCLTCRRKCNQLDWYSNSTDRTRASFNCMIWTPSEQKCENCRYSHYLYGDLIESVRSNLDIGHLTGCDAYSSVENKSLRDFCKIYGSLEDVDIQLAQVSGDGWCPKWEVYRGHLTHLEYGVLDEDIDFYNAVENALSINFGLKVPNYLSNKNRKKILPENI